MAMLAGFGFLVSLAVNRGWITPAMLFGFVCVVCAAFIGIGLRIREEKEQFGQILVAIGAGGLYLNFAAGHVYQHLYSGQVLVSLCLGLSLSTLGYSLWLGSLAFLVLGSLGGFGAALMPLDQGKVAMSIGVHFCVLVASLLVALRHRSMIGAAALFGLGILATLPAAFSPAILHGHHFLPSMSIALTAGMCVLVYGLCFQETPWDAEAVCAPVALVAAALLAFAVDLKAEAWIPCLSLAGMTGMGALSVAVPKMRRRLWLGSSAIAGWIAPFALNEMPCAMVLASIALATGLLGVRVPWRGFILLSGVGIVLASITYLAVPAYQNPPWTLEIPFLAVLIGAICACGRASWLISRNREGQMESLIFNIVAVSSGLAFSRLAFLSLWTSHTAPEMVAVFVGIVLFSLILSGVSIMSQRGVAAGVVILFFGMAALAYAPAFENPIAPGWDALCVLLLTAAALAAGRSCWLATRDREAAFDSAVLIGAATAAGLGVARLVFVVCTASRVVPPNVASLFGFLAVAVALSRLTWTTKRREFGWLGAVFALCAGTFYADALQEPFPTGWEIVCLLAMMGAALSVGRACWKVLRTADPSSESLILDVTSVAVGLASARLVFVVLSAARLAPQNIAAVFGFVAVSLGLAVLAWKTRRKDFGPLALIFALLALPFYAFALQAPLAPLWELICLSSLIIAALSVGRACWLVLRGDGPSLETLIVDLTAIAVGLACARLTFVVCTASHTVPANIAAMFGLSLVSLALSGLSWLTPRKVDLGILALAFALAGGPFYAVALTESIAPWWEILGNLGLLAAWLISIGCLVRAKASAVTTSVLGTGGAWVLCSRLGIVVLGMVGMAPTAAITATWLGLAAVLIALGFVLDVVELRYASFLVMGATALKVVLLDLAQVDPAIRVLLLMGLGAVMLGGGYWTIRRERNLTHHP